MKKIGKKLSYFTKVLLVLGLIISNLSSLSVVFAYEGEDDNPEVVSDTLSDEVTTDKVLVGFDAKLDDGKITATYDGEVSDTDELQILVSEVYTYHNCEVTDSVLACDITVNNSYEVKDANRELLLGEGMVINYTSDVLSQAKFDGTYKIVASLVNVTDNNTVLGEKELENKENTFESGIEFKVYGTDSKLVNEASGKYVFTTDDANIKILGKMLPGGISPNDLFVYGEDGHEYSALEFLDLEFSETVNLNDYLYGEYKLPIDIIYSVNGESTTYTKNFTISHGTYEDNANKLNGLANSNKFVFESTTKDGKLYVYLGETEITIDEINQILSDAYTQSENIEYSFSNEEVNAGTKITITDGITTISYQVIVVGDINDDGVLNEDDIIALTDQLVGNEELDLDKANIDDTDNEANTRDVLKLAKIVESGTWGIEVSEKEVQLDSELQFQDSETEIVSGDEFTVNYVIVSSSEEVNGFAGLVNYDKTMLKLVSLTASDNFIGSNKDGKFVYVNYESKVQSTSSGETSEEIKLLTLNFKALASGSGKVTIDNPEYFNQDTYYKIVELDEETGELKPSTKVISLDVSVSESNDNSLSSLKLGDNEIELKDGVYDYELTVSNDVTNLDVSALTSNVAASITSIVSPEELVEGENTITITVASESGEETTYTVVVTREKAPEETETNNNDNSNQTTYQGNYYNNNNNNNKTNEPTTTKPVQNTDPEPVKKDSKLSKFIIVGLILLVIAGLIYLIFKDDDDEAKQTNKDINKLKNEDIDSPKQRSTMNNNNNGSSNNHSNKNQNKNNKKGR